LELWREPEVTVQDTGNIKSVATLIAACGDERIEIHPEFTGKSPPLTSGHWLELLKAIVASRSGFQLVYTSRGLKIAKLGSG
jgi:hypothetical protein